MLNYQKILTVENSVENLSTISQVKIKDMIKFNLGVAYFIVLTFSVLKLLFT